MKLGKIDLDPKPEYMLVYKDKRDDTINTWTLDESAMVVNYKQMKQSGNVEFLGIYQKVNDNQILDILVRQ